MRTTTKDAPSPDGGHRVHFFDNDESLAGAVAGHLGAAVAGGESAVVIATPEHRELVSAVLTAAGVDVAAAVEDGSLLLHDAAATLARLDIAVAADFRRALSAAVHTGLCVLDASGVDFIDLAGPRHIAEAARSGVTVRVVGAPPIVRRGWTAAGFAAAAPTVELVG